MRSASTEPVEIDPAHQAMDIFSQDITQDIWKDKYKYGSEQHPYDTFARVVEGIYALDRDKKAKAVMLALMNAGIWMPGGRIIAGAGTAKHVTLMNCYVNRTLDDSMEGIADAFKDLVLTLRQGGGVGTDFSTLRPRRALLKRLGEGAMSSGAVSFMDIWHTGCNTIMSAGARRGAMMGTLDCSHPDLPEFIKAKQEKGRLTNFNVSILVTDAFMRAVQDDQDWELYFHVPPVDGSHIREFTNPEGKQYVYQVIKARELWDMILKNTYDYAEPGVIFIDRINKLNNLEYCENIRCTNPCGEQPLPPNGTCNLGAINLSRLIRNPFTDRAYVDMKLLQRAVFNGVRFLDNVIDVTRYPLANQADEEKSKRRLGLGISGLGNALAMLNLRYGSEASIAMTSRIMQEIAITAYEASTHLAEERGGFPLCERGQLLERPFICSLPDNVQDRIANFGLRNGLILTIAPTGTTSLLYGNISSGLEPTFAFEGKRKVLQPDGSKREYPFYDYAYLLYHKIHNAPIGSLALPSSMIEADKVLVKEHIDIQAACQRWVDASISKTINCPGDITYEAFKEVYWYAYEQGCKGCTTYRPSEVRGSVLEKATAATGPQEPPSNEAQTISASSSERPEVLDGKTYKIKWPNRESALYLTINERDGKPYEFFISSKTSENAEWINSLTRMISAIMRQGIDVTFVAEELQQISSAHDSGWVDGKHYNSLPAYIGAVLEKHLKLARPVGEVAERAAPVFRAVSDNMGKVTEDTRIIGEGLSVHGETCPKCQSPTLIRKEGCKSCENCGYSNCG